MIGNKKYGSNPYRGKPIPKGRIEWAVGQAKSARQAAKLLDVDFNTFKKYAVMYDLYEGVKNKEQRDYRLENIEFLCFNCYYLYVGNLNNRHKKI